jgi:hypothetical protein
MDLILHFFVDEVSSLRRQGTRAGPRSMAAQIAASDHGSPHKADTPDAHCSSVAINGWNCIQGTGSLNFLLEPWALCGEAT